ncbi:MAG: penicillin-binding protein 2, partial [Lentisphaerae bacterium]|nr:penicillin-binding protein 2 [Lentisphaerota bacterium]
HILALDLVRPEARADPEAVLRVDALDQVSTVLADLLELDREELRTKLNQPERRDVSLLGFGRVVDNRQAERLRELNLPGVFMREMMVRSYPRGASLCHVLGFVNLERHGSAGIEQRFDRYLRGVPGLLVSELDGRRRELYNSRMLEIRPRPGADVILTIDQYVQYLVEQALARAVVENDALAGWAIVQRVQTGEILAMAGYPGFDGNDFRGTDMEIRRNRCISYNFEPGSTFKMAVIAAALDAGVVRPEQVYDCENGVWIHHNRPLRDYHPHGMLTVADIIKKSSNIGAAKIALELGANRLYRYLREFGVGEAMEVDLPGEERGILHPTSRWSALSVSRIAMGHEVAVTALQVLGILNALANDGVLMKPLIVREVRDKDGRVLWRAEREELGRPVRPETAALMMRLLARVTEEDGTGRRARVPGYTVAGKTGTAQKIVDGAYSERLNISSFVGVLPAENPRLGIIVVLDEPKAVRTGGAAAAPVFSEIAGQAVRYLDIAPTAQRQGLTAAPTIQGSF